MMKRLISVLLCAMLALSVMLPAMADVRAGGADFYQRVADPNTMDSWMTLFGPDVKNTANVGTVWTDKTVTKDVPTLSGSNSKYKFTMENSGTNFMTTLSTISATMSITGHETLPTDTVFVLDLSSSMYGSSFTTNTVDQMVNAVNNAMHRLLKLNPLNRVSVIVYYGDGSINAPSTESHHKVMFPLATYKTISEIPEGETEVTHPYLKRNGGNKFTSLSVNANLQYPDGTKVPNNLKKTHTPASIAGTYIQLGLEKAREMLVNEDNETTIPPDEDFQAGATRIPIIVLMSDGEPTAADDAWYNVGEADAGCNSTGERSPAESDFMTQLTAAYTRKLIDDYYVATTPLFYTIGLGNSISYDVMDPKGTDDKYASLNVDHRNYELRTKRASSTKHVNDPEIVNAKVKYYWEQLDEKSSVSFNVIQNENGSTKVNDWLETPITVSKHANFPSSPADKYYVDKFFSASTAGDLATAFASLVNEIILQSAYYPTYVENGAIGMSGYVDFHDEIGDMMEVKAVHGLVRKANSDESAKAANKAYLAENDGHFYYKGEQIAQHIQACINAGGDQLARARSLTARMLQVRLKLTETQAQNIIDAIIEANNSDNPILYYKSNTDYSNAFSWYAKADDSFISLAPSKVAPAAGESIPDGAYYHVTTYWYANPDDMENTNSFIRVKTALDGDRKQCVTWSVPASMIPLVKYAVTIPGNELEEGQKVEVAYTDNYPMRAMFEVGLRSEINKYNAVQFLKEAGYGEGNRKDNDVLFDEETGVYHFYSNKWQYNNNTVPQPDINNPDAADNTIAHFRPSEQNERYFITTDSPLFRKSDNQEYTGDANPSNNAQDYYVKVHEFYQRGEEWYMRWKDVTLPDTFTAERDPDSKKWYVNIRTPKTPDVIKPIEKTENTTSSLPYSTIEKMDKDAGVDYSLSILGNNGTFSFTADTGIEITKQVNLPEGKNPTFTFIIEPAEDNDATLSGSYAVEYHTNGTQIENTPTSIAAVDGKITVELKAGQSVYIAGNAITATEQVGYLPAGNYKITELVSGDDDYFYEVKSVTVTQPGKDPAAKGAHGTVEVPVENNEVTDVLYTNEPFKTGSIEISKAVTENDLNAPAPEDAVFTFEIQLDKDRHANKQFQMIKGGVTSYVTADANGKIADVTLKGGETVKLLGVAAEQPVNVTVKENEPPTGFTAEQATQNAEVKSGQVVEFPFTNKYAVKPASVEFSGNKTLENLNLAADMFTFQLYETDADYDIAGHDVLQQKQNAADGTYAFDAIEYTVPGTHYYVVQEIDTVPGVTNDTKVYHIRVDVVDENAQLVATVTGATADALDFTNTYTAAGTSVSLSGTKSLTGRDMLNTDEFTFGLYQADEQFTKGELVQQVNNAGENFAFTPLTFDKVGVYRYVVVEEPVAGIANVTASSVVYQVTVTVTDNLQGQLNAAVNIIKVEDETRTENIQANGLAFQNIYTPAPTTVNLGGVKTVTGDPYTLTDGQFSFKLQETDANFGVLENGRTESVSNQANGSYAFSELTFTEAGTYYFVVTEETGTLPGMTYSNVVYHTIVEVTDNPETGALSAQTTVETTDGTAADATALNFQNAYDATDTAIVLSGTKVLEGRPIREGEFSFELYQTDSTFSVEGLTAKETVQNTENTFIFSQLDYNAAGTYYYVVKEANTGLANVTYDPAEYHVTVVVADENAELKPTATVEKAGSANTPAAMTLQIEPISVNGLAFQNIYTPAPTTVNLGGVKTVTGDPYTLTDDQFSFKLQETDADFAPLAEGRTESVSNQENGSYAFRELTFTEAGTYYFEVTEETGTLPGMTYSNVVYHAIVEVTDNPETGALSAQTTVETTDGTAADVAALNFQNAYDATDTAFAFSGAKTLEGRNLKDDEFTFALHTAKADADGDGWLEIDDAVQAVTVTNKDGRYAFPEMEIQATGTYYYIVKEVPGSLERVTYDATEYHITVTVTDENGVLTPDSDIKIKRPAAENTPAMMSLDPIPLTITTLDFTNTYTPDGISVPLSGNKTMTGRELQENDFTFSLYAADEQFNATGDPVQTVTNAADGTFAFAALEYSSITESPGTYRYVVVEAFDEATAIKGVAYDETVYRITVEIGYDADNGVFTKDVTVTKADGTAADATALNFQNTYDATDGGVKLSGVKRLIDVPTEQPISLTGSEYTFGLYPATVTDGVFSAGDTALQTAQNAADGTFTFEQLDYTAAGTYYYVVKEVPGENPGVTYDETEYHITVVVTDETAALTPVVTIEKYTAVTTFAAVRPEAVIINQDGLDFTNYYDADDTEITFSGEKILQGRDAQSDEFIFELYETDDTYAVTEEPIQTAKNVVDQETKTNTFAFLPIEYSVEGTYYYVVREQDTNLPGMTYDGTEYRIEVTVADSAEAKLTAVAKVTIKDAEGETDVTETTLTFTNTYDATDAGVYLQGHKTLTVPEGLTRTLQPGEFSFALYKAKVDDQGGFTADGEAIETVQNDADGKFVFTTELPFDAIGTYHYIVREVPGTLPGVFYDPTEYHITVTVSDVEAQLRPVVTAERWQPATTFALRPAEKVTVTFAELDFTNEYAVEATDVTFSGEKRMTGRNLNENEFEFRLYSADKAEDGTYVLGEEIESVHNGVDGAFAFTKLTYTTEGDFYYIVKEVPGNNPATTYDPVEYHIHVRITDVDAVLQAEVTVEQPIPAEGEEAPTHEKLDFHNIHDEMDAEIIFFGKKTYLGHSLSHGDFTFTLFQADETYTVGDPIQTVTNEKDGAFAFDAIVFDKVGLYHYVIREDAGAKGYISYDTAEYHIDVNVWNDDGVLKADVTANRVLGEESTPVEILTTGAEFTNRYNPSGVVVPFKGLKIYSGAELAEGMFTFHLYQADSEFRPQGQPLQSVTNAADGTFAFSSRAFHTTGIYHFVVVEDASNPLPKVTYDTTVYHVTVRVWDNGYGSLVATTEITTGEGLAAEQPVFENVFWAVPDTGDNSRLTLHLALCLMSLMGIAWMVIARRRART